MGVVDPEDQPETNRLEWSDPVLRGRSMATVPPGGFPPSPLVPIGPDVVYVAYEYCKFGGYGICAVTRDHLSKFLDSPELGRVLQLSYNQYEEWNRRWDERLRDGPARLAAALAEQHAPAIWLIGPFLRELKDARGTVFPLPTH